MLVVPDEFDNLYAAVKAAKDEETILLREGIYEMSEPLEIDKPIAIVGNAATEKVALVFESTTAIVVSSFKVRLSKLTVRLKNARFCENVVEVSRGEVTVQHCRLDGGHCSARVLLGAKLQCISAEICNSLEHGVLAQLGGIAEIRDSFFHDCKLDALHAIGSETCALLADTEVFNCGRNGVFCDAGSEVDILGSKIHGISYSGVVAAGARTKATIDDSTISDCEQFGVTARAGAVCSLEKVVFLRITMANVYADGGTIEDSKDSSSKPPEPFFQSDGYHVT